MTVNGTPESSDDRVVSPLAELGLVIDEVDDELHGRADVVANMWAPGTESLRASILVTWADTILGLLAVRALAPRVPVTLELDIHLFESICGTPTIELIARVTKLGSTVQVVSVDIRSNGERAGFGHSLFMASPDPRVSMPPGNWALERFASRRGVLTRPLAERVGCVRTGPGTAELPLGPSLLNQSKSMNGGLLAVVVEEAALSARNIPTSLMSLQMRYLRPVRSGPAVARADVQGDLGEIEVTDAATGTLAVVATARFAPR